MATHELLHLTHPLGAQDAALEAVRTRSHRHGPPIAVWNAETGTQNRIVSLWALDGDRSVPATTGGEDWLDGDHVSRTLEACRPVAADSLRAPLVELRCYAPHPGQCGSFVTALLDALPHRERHSPCAGLWTTRQRDRDVVVHLWPYASYDARLAARAAAHRDPAWGEYRARIRPMLAAMHATLMSPVAL
ncbi:MAG: NIPSNAP family protein [Burkholderiales bacterium]